MNTLFLIHQMFFGGIAAAGFGVLFNIQYRALVWCFAAGALALAIRTIGLSIGCSLEAASFAAALTIGCAVRLFQKQTDVSRSALASAGCIPMVPGSFAAKALLGFIAVTQANPVHPGDLLVEAVVNLLRVVFTVGAIGTGLSIPTLWPKMWNGKSAKK